MAAVVTFHFERENQGEKIPLRPDKIFETNQVNCVGKKSHFYAKIINAVFCLI